MLKVDTLYEKSVEVKHSKFIAFLLPYSQFDTKIEELKGKHPKASHIVSAYRHFNICDQIAEGSSDDGEPKGCAGLPVLNVLRGNNMIDSAIVIVRYFGGTKLGMGGMVRAYTLAAKSVMEIASLVAYRKMFSFKFETDYSSIQRIEYMLDKLAVTEMKKEFLSDRVLWEIGTGKEIFEKFRVMSGEFISIL